MARGRQIIFIIGVLILIAIMGVTLQYLSFRKAMETLHRMESVLEGIDRKIDGLHRSVDRGEAI